MLFQTVCIDALWFLEIANFPVREERLKQKNAQTREPALSPFSWHYSWSTEQRDTTITRPNIFTILEAREIRGLANFILVRWNDLGALGNLLNVTGRVVRALYFRRKITYTVYLLSQKVLGALWKWYETV